MSSGVALNSPQHHFLPFFLSSPTSTGDFASSVWILKCPCGQAQVLQHLVLLPCTAGAAPSGTGNSMLLPRPLCCLHLLQGYFAWSQEQGSPPFLLALSHLANMPKLCLPKKAKEFLGPESLSSCLSLPFPSQCHSPRSSLCCPWLQPPPHSLIPPLPPQDTALAKVPKAACISKSVECLFVSIPGHRLPCSYSIHSMDSQLLPLSLHERFLFFHLFFF